MKARKSWISQENINKHITKNVTLTNQQDYIPLPFHDKKFDISLRVSMGWWLLRLSAKILALLRLSINFFQLRLTKKLKINFFCFKKLNIN